MRAQARIAREFTMPNSRPVATDLLEVVREFLSKEVSPQLPAFQQFQLRIADRLLEILGREWQSGAACDAEELARLQGLLTAQGTLQELNAELCRRIRDGRVSVDDPALLAHLRRSTEDALRINNPKWIQAPTAAPATRHD